MKRLKNILRAVNLYTYWTKRKVYVRLLKVAKNEIEILKRARKGIMKSSTSSADFITGMQSYVGLCKNYHYGFKFLSGRHKWNGETTYYISKDKVKDEVMKVYLNEIKS